MHLGEVGLSNHTQMIQEPNAILSHHASSVQARSTTSRTPFRPPAERREVRRQRARPLLESLRQWFEATLLKLSRKSDTTTAIRYALGLWEALTRYCDDGRLEIDNNAAERALRAVALGRKNLWNSKAERP
jgi:hypothetical protein